MKVGDKVRVVKDQMDDGKRVGMVGVITEHFANNRYLVLLEGEDDTLYFSADELELITE